MSQEPIIPSMLADEVVHSQLRNWVVAESSRQSAAQIEAVPQPLIPHLRMSANEILGIPGVSMGEPGTPRLERNTRRTLRLWVSEGDKYVPETTAAMCQSLRWIGHPLVFTCFGNSRSIVHTVTTHADDALAVANLISSAHSHSYVQEEDADFISDRLDDFGASTLTMESLAPPQPPWGEFPSNLIPFNTLLKTLMSLPKQAIGFWQVVLEPLPDQWASAVRLMARAETIAARHGLTGSGLILREDADRIAQDKLAGALFAAVARVALFMTDENKTASVMGSLRLMMAGLQFSGGSLRLLTTGDFISNGVSSECLRLSLLDGATFHPGFIVCPREVALFVRWPTQEDVLNRHYALDRVPKVLAKLDDDNGIVVANQIVFAREVPVIWSQNRRTMHMVVAGATGSGKTTFVNRLISNALNANSEEGGAVVDPHDKAADEVACAVYDKRGESLIYADLSDTEFVLGLPLFDCPPAEFLDVAVGNVCRQVFSVLPDTEQHFNIRNAMSNVVRTILQIPESSFLDSLQLTHSGRQGEKFRDDTCGKLEDEFLRDYWMHEFPSLDKATQARIRGRFLSMLQIRSLKRLLANKIRRTSLTDIMDRGKVLIAKIPPRAVGPDATNIISGLYYNGLMSSAYSRAGSEGKRPVFTFVAEELGNHSNPKHIPHALRTLRAFDISMILVTQNVDALSPEMKIALGNVDTHVVFSQGWEDAQQYFRTFCGSIPVNDFMMQNVGEGYIKIGRHLAAITCDDLPSKATPGLLEDIKRHTRERYGVPIKEFKERMIEEHHTPLADMKDLDLL